jgi:formamidopyrimidine-DNA glycosylase
MPELPELQALAEGLRAATAGRRIEGVRVWQPAAVKTADPPLEALAGRTVDDVWRRGKLIGISAGDLTLLVHLMQAGRLSLTRPAAARPGRTTCLALALEGGEELRLRELSTEHRASVHLLEPAALAAHRPLAALGPEPLGLDAGGWREALSLPPARLHSALREGRRVAGIGRAYATEIMWAGRLAPFARTDRLDDEEWERLARAGEAVLGQALERARGAITTALPDRERRVTAAHGHAGDPCLRCGSPLRRVSFAGYELVYCPRCQTGGRVYADRRTSRFLR